MTLAKTLLYVSQEYFCGFCAIGHNTFPGMLSYWILPNVYVSVLVLFFSSLVGLVTNLEARPTQCLDNNIGANNVSPWEGHLMELEAVQ